MVGRSAAAILYTGRGQVQASRPGVAPRLGAPPTATPDRDMAFPDGTADFRSDTVTRPTPAMYRAMAEAELGDDVYGEDPTVNALEEESAAALGKAAGLFVPTGSMGNQVALLAQTRPGDEVLCVDWAHVRNYEMGAAGAISGVGFRTVATDDGTIRPDDVETAVGGRGYHLPRVTLLAWENTHNVSGGTVVPIETMEATSATARRAGLAIHLDGARLWNAVAATGTPGERYAAAADTVMFCFSKGLGAPIGSVLCGPADLIAEGRLLRKRLGGGMRQVGVIAAAARSGLAARHRLAEDNDLARRLAEGLADRHPGAVDPKRVESNMVVVGEIGLPSTAAEFQAALAAAGVKVGFIRPGALRFVTHYDVDAADVDRVLEVAAGL